MAKMIVKAAVVQAAPVLFDTARTLSRLRDLTREAASQGSDIVVFPEAFVGGYPKGLDFGARMGAEVRRPRRVPAAITAAPLKILRKRARDGRNGAGAQDVISSSEPSNARAARFIAPR